MSKLNKILLVHSSSIYMFICLKYIHIQLVVLSFLLNTVWNKYWFGNFISKYTQSRFLRGFRNLLPEWYIMTLSVIVIPLPDYLALLIHNTVHINFFYIVFLFIHFRVLLFRYNLRIFCIEILNLLFMY